jgi:Holliday junction DNA helicase RuvB
MPRPAPRFRNFIGHRRIVALLRRQLEGAQARGEPFPHTLLHGPSGVGKSLLAGALAAEMGTGIVEAMGYDDRPTLVKKLARLRPHDFLLVDECHRLGPLEQELLCEAIDGDRLPSASRRRGEPKADGDEEAGLPPWTVILVTDQPGRLLDALRKRVVITQCLSHYPEKELKEIVEVLASRADLLLSPQSAWLIARVAGGLPRRARHLLQNLRLYFPDAESRQLGLEQIRQFLAADGIDRAGLGRLERHYLRAIARLDGASLESIGLMLGCDPAYVRREIEPMLVWRGLVRIAPSGRQLTAAGQEWVHRRKPADSSHRCDNGP